MLESRLIMVIHFKPAILTSLPFLISGIPMKHVLFYGQ